MQGNARKGQEAEMTENQGDLQGKRRGTEREMKGKGTRMKGKRREMKDSEGEMKAKRDVGGA